MGKSQQTFHVKDILSALPNMNRFDLYYMEEKKFITPGKRKVGRREVRFYTREDFEKIQVYWRLHEKGIDPKIAFVKANEEIERRAGMESGFNEAVENCGYQLNELVSETKLFRDRRIEFNQYEIEVVQRELREFSHRIVRLDFVGPIEDFRVLRYGKISSLPEDKEFRTEKGYWDSDVATWVDIFYPPLITNQWIRYYWEIECEGLRDLRGMDEGMHQPLSNTRYHGGGRRGINIMHPTRKLILKVSFDYGDVDADFDVFIGRSWRRNDDEYLRLSQSGGFNVIKEKESFSLEVNYPQIGSAYSITW